MWLEIVDGIYGSVAVFVILIGVQRCGGKNCVYRPFLWKEHGPDTQHRDFPNVLGRGVLWLPIVILWALTNAFPSVRFPWKTWGKGPMRLKISYGVSPHSDCKYMATLSRPVLWGLFWWELHYGFGDTKLAAKEGAIARYRESHSPKTKVRVIEPPEIIVIEL